jgi:Holliday junction resolvasome RuvABC DNA-binding subunit
MANMMKVNNTYAGMRKEQCIATLVQMGYNADQVRAFLDHVGIAEESFHWVIDYLNNPQYKNVLKY